MFVVATIALAALGCGRLVNAANNITSFGEKSFRILSGAGTDLFMLNFNPHSSPPSLKEEFRYPGVIRGGAYPWIARHPENRNLFVVANDNHDLGEISSFRYDAAAGNITLLDRIYSNGSCAHLAISPDGSTVHVANLYGNGKQGPNGALIPIDADTGKFGSLSIPSFLDFGNYTLQPGQINSSQLLRHPHHWAFHPYLPVAYLSDLGADLVRRYHIVGEGKLEPLEPINNTIASGPRRTIIHPSGRALYTLHEISSTISVGKIDTTTPFGNVTMVQVDVDILKPESNHTANVFQGSEMQVSSDGRFLYATSRNNSVPASGGGSNDDAIALFSISPNGTYIERLGFYSSGNWYLRFFALNSPYLDQTLRGQQYLISGGQMSNNTSMFQRDLVNGSLVEIAQYNSTGQSPTAYIWM